MGKIKKINLKFKRYMSKNPIMKEIKKPIWILITTNQKFLKWENLKIWKTDLEFKNYMLKKPIMRKIKKSHKIWKLHVEKLNIAKKKNLTSNSKITCRQTLEWKKKKFWPEIRKLHFEKSYNRKNRHEIWKLHINKR